MSVAFRRESDEEHKEPRFELPVPPGPNLVTPRGLRLTGERVEALEARLAGAAGDGEREELARDLRYWRTRLATATLAPPPRADRIMFGARTRIKVNGRERVIEIVGDDEAEPGAGRIAFSAPLARALMGLAEGDLADFAGRTDALEVLEILDGA